MWQAKKVSSGAKRGGNHPAAKAELCAAPAISETVPRLVEDKVSSGVERVGTPNGVARLARFFPQAVPVRIPVRVTRVDPVAAASAEHTVIEFGTPGEVLFASELPLDFEDTVRVKNSDGSLDVEAEIVAMQLHHGKTAVAARFLGNVTNWIIKTK